MSLHLPRRPLLSSVLCLACTMALPCISLYRASEPQRRDGARPPAVQTAPSEAQLTKATQLSADDTELTSADRASVLPVIVQRSLPRHGAPLAFSPRALTRAPKHSPPSARV